MNQPTFPSDDDLRAVQLTVRDIRDAARILSRLAVVNAARPVEPGSPKETARPPVTRESLLKRARQALHNRRRRVQFFGADIVGEPGWDMLLILYVEDQGQRQTIARLTRSAEVASSTGLRWIKHLEDINLVRRIPHPLDSRSVYIELADGTREKLDSYFSETFIPTR